jgi:hypothetical protein
MALRTPAAVRNGRYTSSGVFPRRSAIGTSAFNRSKADPFPQQP